MLLPYLLIILICSFCFRVRGGFGEKWDWKFPLCKWWFCIGWTACSIYLMPTTDWSSWLFWEKIISIALGARLSTQFCGWGEAIGCALDTRKPDPHEYNELDFDEFCDNFTWKEHKILWWTIPAGKLIDHAVAFGIVWLTLRGVLLSYLMASPMNSIGLMLWGAPMGVIYWFAGWLYRHGLDDGKSGWRTAEWLYGAWLGLGLVIWKGILQ